MYSASIDGGIGFTRKHKELGSSSLSITASCPIKLTSPINWDSHAVFRRSEINSKPSLVATNKVCGQAFISGTFS